MDHKLVQSLIILFGRSKLKEKSVFTVSEIRRAYYSKAKQYHPDMVVISGDNAHDQTEKFKKVSEAYSYLLSKKKSTQKISSSEKKYHYDRNYGSNGTFYSGSIPSKKLKFAEYLYYRGCIEWRDLISAISWQVRNRPKFGDIAVRLNYIDSNKLKDLISDYSSQLRIGEKALKRAYINHYQLFVILGMQKKADLPIGKYFISRGLISEGELNSLLLQNREHNSRMSS